MKKTLSAWVGRTSLDRTTLPILPLSEVTNDQVSGHFESELRRVTRLRADLSFSRQEPKLAKFGENAQLAFCNEFFSFRRVEQTPSQTITVHTGFSDRETDSCFGEWSEKLVGLGLFG